MKEKLRVEIEDKTVRNLIYKFALRAEESNFKHKNTIDQVNKSQMQWVTEALEEAMDMCVYLQRLKEKMLEDATRKTS